ncbi:Protein CBG18531 [Caenorhabditis briggsae]|uniref:Protein CBG18531 n=2 Tax=Caenorhabditis briggsae TaxID=6238 RepID=A8XTI4_CAEBR|nr:Protein CBG18531 [Caenorhabditis briggsae]ULT86335.1 hypothetical protein L3Y34_006186 [Caenorhabditis briggsae]CAP35961.1 Protein CBG18531 [Caenorhabditis briggsae]
MSSNDKYGQREADREGRVNAARASVQQKHEKSYSALREEQEKELEQERLKSKKLAEEKKDELIEIRKQQAQELADFEKQIEANVKEQVQNRQQEGREEAQRRKVQLEKQQKELENQAELRRAQLNDSSNIMKNGEKLRQECLNRLRDDRKKEQKEMNAQILEMNQKLHETRIKGEERLQELDEKRNEEQKQQLLKKERVILNGIANSEALSRSLAIEDGFERFKQHTVTLRNRHRGFSNEYDSIEPQLLKMHDRMRRGKNIDYCDMDDLTSALRVFRDQAAVFSAEGSTAENDFQQHIAELIELLRQLMTNINGIKAAADEYDDQGEANNGGIAEPLSNISELMKAVGVLMQQFNVIGRDHLQETLAIQMKQAQSSRHQALEGPPAYGSEKQKIIAALTEN